MAAHIGKIWLRFALLGLALALSSCVIHQTPSAGPAGRGSAPTEGGNNDPPTATGIFTDWVDAVCLLGTFNDGKSAGLPNADKGQGFCGAKNRHGPILMGLYSNFYMARNDVARYQHGMSYAYANVEPGIQVFVGAPDALQPLNGFGFVVNQPSQVPVPQPAPGPDATAAPVPTVTAPPTQTSQPYWDGPWLRNYWEGNEDCNTGGRYWVVQPGDTADMYALRIGCFPQARINDLNAHCRSFNLPSGKCAVLDQNNIMSSFNAHGDLLVVALTQACLDRAGLPDFHEGPLHQDCVTHP
jgi:hypothetical protein